MTVCTSTRSKQLWIGAETANQVNWLFQIGGPDPTLKFWVIFFATTVYIYSIDRDTSGTRTGDLAVVSSLRALGNLHSVRRFPTRCRIRSTLARKRVLERRFTRPSHVRHHAWPGARRPLDAHRVARHHGRHLPQGGYLLHQESFQEVVL